uniref:Uncharacterized protein n=1 Tax=Amphimedon queenslandica TaxID=400682 RepID=A0A1X7TTF7_AMPQE
LIANQAGWFGGLVSRAASTLLLFVLGCCLCSSDSPHSVQHGHFSFSTYRAEALACSSKLFPSLTPPGDDKECSQFAWDRPQVDATIDNLLESVSNDVDHARLIAVSADVSGA